jgi:hypothetical protein
MELKMTFVIKTSIPADALEMNILKKFDFHNKDDVQAWSPNFTELTDNKRPMFIDIVYDPAIHDLDEMYDYIINFDEDQNKETSCENSNDQLCPCQCPYCYEIFAEKIDEHNSEPSFMTVCPNCGGALLILK